MRKIQSIIIALTLFMSSGCLNKFKIKLIEPDYTTMTLQEIKDYLRKDYRTFDCPKKSDRLFISDEVWQQIDWSQEELYRNAALPHKMWNMRHDDHKWPACKQWRGDDAFGPLAGIGHDKYFPPLPQLVIGRGIARWMTQGDTSVIEINLFKDYNTLWTLGSIPNTIEVIERKHRHINYGKTFTLTKEELTASYAPSPLQKFSDKSYLEVYPTHKSYHIMIDKKETYTGKPDGPDEVYFWRYGWRWDSNDSYYIKGAKYIGGHWN